MYSKRRRHKFKLFSAFVKRLNDGGRSRNDWATRPLIAHVCKNVYISNFAAAQKAAASVFNVGVLNVRSDQQIRHAVNTIAVDDNLAIPVEEFETFAAVAAKKIEELSSRHETVVVCCRAGINRSSTAVLAWLASFNDLKLYAAVKLLKAQKAAAARRFQFKNRYQSFEHGPTLDSYSWPTLSGGASKVLKEALKSVVKTKFI